MAHERPLAPEERADNSRRAPWGTERYRSEAAGYPVKQP